METKPTLASIAPVAEEVGQGATASPLVTVLMPVYNSAQYLKETIDSILCQTFSDFEFLIYNDGSTDSTSEIIRSYSDKRIILIENSTNRGIATNLNEGIKRARGRYIVRIDGDDIAHPERIAKQVAYLEAHPEVGLCGSAVRYIGASSTCVYLPQDNETIRQQLWLQNAFYHPSVIIRAQVLHQHNLRYDRNFEPAEDYKLWSDMSAVTKLHNLGEILLDYRIHPHQVSHRQSSRQQQVSGRIRREQMQRLGIRLQPEQEAAYNLLTIEDGWMYFQSSEYAEVAKLPEKLRKQSRELAIPVSVIDNVITQQWGVS